MQNYTCTQHLTTCIVNVPDNIYIYIVGETAEEKVARVRSRRSIGALTRDKSTWKFSSNTATRLGCCHRRTDGRTDGCVAVIRWTLSLLLHPCIRDAANDGPAAHVAAGVPVGVAINKTEPSVTVRSCAHVRALARRTTGTKELPSTFSAWLESPNRKPPVATTVADEAARDTRQKMPALPALPAWLAACLPKSRSREFITGNLYILSWNWVLTKGRDSPTFADIHDADDWESSLVCEGISAYPPDRVSDRGDCVSHDEKEDLSHLPLNSAFARA